MASNGTEFGAVIWRKSSYSSGDGGNCVEIADGLSGAVPVRDSKVQGGPVLVIGATAWAGFVAGLKSH